MRCQVSQHEVSISIVNPLNTWTLEKESVWKRRNSLFKYEICFWCPCYALVRKIFDALKMRNFHCHVSSCKRVWLCECNISTKQPQKQKISDRSRYDICIDSMYYIYIQYTIHLDCTGGFNLISKERFLKHKFPDVK